MLNQLVPTVEAQPFNISSPSIFLEKNNLANGCLLHSCLNESKLKNLAHKQKHYLTITNLNRHKFLSKMLPIGFVFDVIGRR